MFSFNKFTFKAQEAFQKAQDKAISGHHSEIRALHLLWALVSQEDTLVRDILEHWKINHRALLEAIEFELNRIPKIFTSSNVAQLYFSQEAMQVVDQANHFANRLKDEFISCEHLFLALSEVRTISRFILEKFGLNREKILKAIEQLRGGQKVTDEMPETKFKVLEKYSVNLTQLARERKLDPVIGREREIRRIIEILSRRTKNNPILIGEPGVGKTAIVEGLAQRIAMNDVPESLKKKEIISLDIGAMIAGTKFRGEFEDRLKAFLKEVKTNQGKFIIFVDEIHTLVGAGAAEGAIDAANLLKPSLTKGDFQLIGATTFHDYKLYIEKDPAFARRLQPVQVEEPSIEDTIAILRGLKEKYELHHGIKISDSAIISAVQLSARYISDRFLPDKAIDLIDEACAAVRLETESTPQKVEELKREITKLEIEREALLKEPEPAKTKLKEIERKLKKLTKLYDKYFQEWKEEKEKIQTIHQIKQKIDSLKEEAQIKEKYGEFSRVAEILYGELPALKEKLKKLESSLKRKRQTLIKEVITEEDVAEVVARWTGIPVSKILETEAEKLVKAEEIISRRVVGQKTAIKAVANALRRARAGLADEDKPIASFMFLGPTGVGKTELAKALAELMFNDEKAMVRLDMSEYMESHSVAKLIGSPPGYVGYEEGGQLTEIIRRKPYSLILFDEIEKAHPEVFNILLQILDDGRLTDSHGRTVNFRNTIIIMTSNIGSYYFKKVGSIGFSTEELKSYQDYKDKVIKALRDYFKPEFLNRIDEIIIFNPLTKKDLKKIVDIQLDRVKARLKEKGYKLEIDEKTKEFLIEKGFDDEYGARPLKRAIQKYILDPLAEKIIKQELKPGRSVFIQSMKEGLVISSK